MNTRKWMRRNFFIKRWRVMVVSFVAGTIASLFVVGLSVLVLWVADFRFVRAGSEIGTDTESVVAESAPVVDFGPIVSRTISSVYSIVASKNFPVYEQYYEAYDPLSRPLQALLPRVRIKQYERKTVGGATGFRFDSSGLVVTNNHVVADKSARYVAVDRYGVSYPVEVVYRRPEYDIAFVRLTGITASDYLSLADNSEIELGQPVISMGNSFSEFHHSVSVGVVSGLERTIRARDRVVGKTRTLVNMVQTDAFVFPGNSGGPLINAQGKAVGVVTALSEESSGMGFAVSANTVSTVFAEYLTNAETD